MLFVRSKTRTNNTKPRVGRGYRDGMALLHLRSMSVRLPAAVRRTMPGATAAGPVLLELDLARGLIEAAPPDPVSALRARRVPSLRTVVDRLRQAESHPAVVGLVAHIDPGALTASQAEELGAAVEQFAATGRPTVCWTESFGELGPGTVPYLLAVHFDQVWLQPSGSLGLVGVSTVGVFVRDALDRLGLEPQISQRHEYKSAADLFMRSSMPDAQREALQRVTDSVVDQVVAVTARRRKLTPQQVRAGVDHAPLSAEQALARGFVDRLGYRDEVYDELRRRLSTDGRLRLRYVDRWSPGAIESARKRATARAAPTVAVVPVLGAISTGRSGSSPLSGARSGSDTVTAALRTATDLDEVRAVVLRVVSPGGSYVASDAVRRAVLRVRQSGRPVVASMGSVAASGGYFVAMPCDEVVATPSTITGSIGVVGGKVVIREALRRVGVGVEPVGTGARAGMFGPERRFDDEEWRQVEEWLDAVYDDFTRKAAADRRMPLEQLEPLARGRVWTGADAVQHGLVDRLGGMRLAVTRAAQRAGVDPERVQLLTLPHLTPLDRVRPTQSSETPAAAASTWGAPLPPAAGLEARLRWLWSSLGQPVPGVLTLPGPWELR